MNALMRFIHKTGSPAYFFRLSGKLLPWFAVTTIVLTIWGLYHGLVVAPPDYQQGDSYRIIFIHVPSAWMSMFVYLAMAVFGAIALIWRIRIAEILAMASAPIGAAFTFITLVTGALWGKPMWGTYWVWDARLTSMLILLFIYLGIIGLYNAIEDPRRGARAASLMAIVGIVMLPIIHYSVEWWATLHQGQTIRLMGESAIDGSMLIPLLVMAFATKFYYVTALLLRARLMLLRLDKRKNWVQEQLGVN